MWVLKWGEHVGFKANQPCNNREVRKRIPRTIPRCSFSCALFSTGDSGAPGNMRLSNCWRDAVRGWPNFNAPSLSVVNLDEVSLFHLGHQPKMFLFLLEEMAYTHISTEDVDGLQVMAYEVLAMAEM